MFLSAAQTHQHQQTFYYRHLWSVERIAAAPVNSAACHCAKSTAGRSAREGRFGGMIEDWDGIFDYAALQEKKKCNTSSWQHTAVISQSLSHSQSCSAAFSFYAHFKCAAKQPFSFTLFPWFEQLFPGPIRCSSPLLSSLWWLLDVCITVSLV